MLVPVLAATAVLALPGGTAPRVDNPWFPLTPGTALVYRGRKDGVPGVDVFRVTHRRRTIAGVATTVVHDRILQRGRLVEDTLDYYAQDGDGAVWYLGEDTKELGSGGRVLSREGTWHAGVDGAQAGIFMPAHPRVGQSFRQELYRGHAEDRFTITAVRGTRLVTRETTRLEPGVVDRKVYRRGVGTVLEETVKGGSERWALAAALRPR